MFAQNKTDSRIRDASLSHLLMRRSTSKGSAPVFEPGEMIEVPDGTELDDRWTVIANWPW